MTHKTKNKENMHPVSAKSDRHLLDAINDHERWLEVRAAVDDDGPMSRSYPPFSQAGV